MLKRQAARSGYCLTILVGFLPGCVSGAQPGITAAGFAEYRRLATDTVAGGISFRNNPSVRIGAIEAMEWLADDTKLPWLRSALLDEHPAVRFAACLALGNARDAASAKAIGRLRNDPDRNVQVASLFARHRLGDTSRTGRLATYLLEDDDDGVRRNAAMVLGRLGEPGGVPILAKAVLDEDPGVRMNALEAMARLGNREAQQELIFQTNSGVGADETFALNALAETRSRKFIEPYRYKLINGTHLETRLAAARGLGLIGLEDGFDLAMSAIRSSSIRIGDREDTEAGQILRARLLGASALGAIGRVHALPHLAAGLRESSDQRVRIAFAGAILEILSAQGARKVGSLGAFGMGGPVRP